MTLKAVLIEDFHFFIRSIEGIDYFALICDETNDFR